MPLPILGGTKVADTTFSVANSCRFNDGDSAYMTRAFDATQTSTSTFTISVWVKRGILGTRQSIFAAYDGSADAGDDLEFETDDTLSYNGSGAGANTTSAKFRDPSAWYHIVVARNSGATGAANQVKIYVNGALQTLGTNAGCNVSQFLRTGLNSRIGASQNGSAYYVDMYMAEFVAIDGQMLTPTSFGEYDEDSPTIWKPKDVSGLTFGTNGFYLDFEDSGDLGDDESGNTNDFTETNLAATDQASDSPTNNFATLNSIAQWDTGGSHVFSEGNLKAVLSSDFGRATSTIGVTAGKWYMEVKQTAENVPLGNSEGILGVIGDPIYTTSNWSGIANSFNMVNQSGSINTGSSAATSWHGNWSVGDIIGVALDMDNMKVYFSKGGQWVDGSGNWDESSPNAYLTLSSSYSTYFLALSHSHNTATETFEANFGSPSFAISSGNADANGYGNFEYAVPSGYLSLCTKNLGSDGA